ncbi:MAG: hypothetical protein Q8R30_02415 [bacterium]|nr:hypothetical protein [bacterium]
MKKYVSRKSLMLKISRFFLAIFLAFSWIFSGLLAIWQNQHIPFTFAAMYSYSRSQSRFTIASPVTFNFSVDAISDICGSSPNLPPAKYWWIVVNSLTETGGSCGGGSFCSQTFDTNTLSVNAQIPLPPRSDYYLTGTFCSDNTSNPNDPNGNFWSPNTSALLEGDFDAPFSPIFNIQHAE